MGTGAENAGRRGRILRKCGGGEEEVKQKEEGRDVYICMPVAVAEQI
jgi:hypothetical protein